MTIIQEIHEWSKGLAEWQQDAIARLYVDRSLGPDDLEDLYALAKAEAGIPDPQGRTPHKLHNEEIAPTPDPARLVQLKAIKDILHVNALSHGGMLPIAPVGLTVIYGENGAGKSGYSRILKHACRARDSRETILPNANLSPEETGRPQATFEVLINGEQEDLAWVHGAESPGHISDISIFDTHCARAYIDNYGDFAYVPYGLDLLEGLVRVCNDLRAKAEAEKAAYATSDAAYSALTRAQTEVAKALNGIPEKTKPEDIEALATLSDADRSRFEVLTKTLAEADPKQKAKSLRQKALRLNGLSQRITSAINQVGDDKLNELRTLIDQQAAAKSAADLAAAEFRDTPGQLSGTGGEEWKALFDAARQFATVSHPDHKFPNLPETSACPLCQNLLGSDGSERLARFDAFIKQAAETTARTARDKAVAAYKAFKAANLDLQIDDALSQELAEFDSELAKACKGIDVGLQARKASALSATKDELAWEEVGKLPEDPRPALTSLVQALNEQAGELEAAADEQAKAAMIAEHAELKARMQLGDVKAAVLGEMGKHVYVQNLQKCIDGMETRRISRKSTQLSQTMASEELARALNDELKRLKVHNLSVGMKPESRGGRTQFKLVLQKPGGGSAVEILSEGEQRAIAIASFLAEIKLGGGSGGVVFDDPVSSLDHRRRWEVATRLAEEAQARQVIIFTHDIYFLCILEQQAALAGADLTKNYIRRTSAGFGVYSDELPFDVIGTKDRVKRLRGMLDEVRASHAEGEDDIHRQLTAELYGRLRLAWERSIEEVLFNEAIQRFGEGVQTKRLMAVTVTDDDYREIDAGMTKSSKFEHDAAMGVGRLPVPDPDEVSADIERLESWRKAVVKRQSDIRDSRQ